jgi:hypothetical protein
MDLLGSVLLGEVKSEELRKRFAGQISDFLFENREVGFSLRYSLFTFRYSLFSRFT